MFFRRLTIRSKPPELSSIGNESLRFRAVIFAFFLFTLVPFTVVVIEESDDYVCAHKVSAKCVVQYHNNEVPAWEERTCTITTKGNENILHNAYEKNGIIINQLTVN